jgi:diguanylate cyclase (GGDEF)-like protein
MKRAWPTKNASALTVLFLVYVVAGKLGLRLASVNPSVSPVWAPTGLAIASILLLGTKAWRPIFLGAFVVNITTVGSFLTALPISIGNTLEAVAGAWALTRLSLGASSFRTHRGILDFALLSAFGSTVISATIGVTTLAIAGNAPWEEFRSIWLTWWLGDATGALIVTPLVVLWATEPMPKWNWQRAAECAAIVVLLTFTVLIVFGGRFPSDVKTYPLEFLCAPLLIWTAFRFGPTQVATAVAAISWTAVWGTMRGFGPFVRATPNESLLLLQIYMSVTAAMGLSLAAVVEGYRRAERQLVELSTTDPLTGLANYRRLVESLRGEIARCNRSGTVFSILFLDLNGLKRINDTLGHLVGSRALCRVADALQRHSRATDTVARFGGDEFAVVLPESTKSGAIELAHRVAAALTISDEQPVVSVTVGVAEYPRDGRTPAALLASADQLLYAVRSGRASQEMIGPVA